jgi:DNA-binding NarL/FixJ family response regulator
MRQPVRVVLADDHDAFVEGLGMVLSAEDDLEVVALAGDGASALQAVRIHRPDVLVVDTQMPGPAVTELVRLVGQARPTTRVLLLAEDARRAPSGHPDRGGHAGLTRMASARELAEAIRAVAAGFRVVAADPPAPGPAGHAPPGHAPARHGSPKPRDPGHAAPEPRDPGTPEWEGSRQPGGVLDAVHSLDTVHSPDPSERDDHAELMLRSLSERERQVLAMLARGWSNRRIAETCFLSLNTVRTHVQNVLVKLGVHSKLEAAALAVRQGLVSIEDPPA